jgi:hypothetical protein
VAKELNAALHAAFDRPDVPLEAGGEAEARPGGSLRSVDRLRDRLADQVRGRAPGGA